MFNIQRWRSLTTVVPFLALMALSGAMAQQGTPHDPEALQELLAQTGGRAQVGLHQATGTVRFLRLQPGDLRLAGRDRAERTTHFFRRHGRVLGVRDAASELTDAGERSDALGHHRRTYLQKYRGVPVFAGMVRMHFDAADELVAVNGTFVPDIALDPKPTRSRGQVALIALAEVRREVADVPSLQVGEQTLLVFREGLLQGIPGADHLAWRVEVTNGMDVREFVFVDAHTGKVITRITGIHSALHRRIHEFNFGNVIWDEGDSLPYNTGDPTNDDQVTGIIDTSEDVYDFFSNLSSGTYVSWDGSDALMHTIWEATFLGCPNASWNGQSTNYCDGVASDDVVGHEWAHAYTERTHGLIYQWQSGALNESYSDIFGEVVDQINGLGTDAPQTVRSAGACSAAGNTIASLEVLTPAGIAGPYQVSDAAFNPPPPVSVTGSLELADDGDDEAGAASVNDACQSLVGFTSGNIAVLDRGTCSFVDKVANAQAAGAIAVVVVNDQGDGLLSMGGSNPAITIPSVFLGQSNGTIIKGELGSGVTATLSLTTSGDPSVRWLLGEDGGAIRDLWTPNCFGHPGRVSDGAYWCSTGDSGGVHINSGIPNHAFALLMDGGVYNGQTIAALGMTKAVNLYWRAMTVYQVPASGFADHADALAQSCSDLIGQSLADPISGGTSGLVISIADCDAVDQAMLAVEMADPPTQCNFQTILAANPPAVTCDNQAFFDDFESNPTAWARSNQGVFAEYQSRDWQWTADVPSGGTGSAFYALNSFSLGNCTPGSNDQSGVMRLTSPVITQLAQQNPFLVFDHYVATEAEWDGGNLKISVNGAAFQPVPSSAFQFNAYNGTLQTAAGGNTNPLAGEQAFLGTDAGSLGGSWGQSQVDLSGLAGPEDSFRLRFDLGVDGCNGVDGWYLDNVQVCTEILPNRPPDFASLGTVVVQEGSAVDVPLLATDPDGDGIVLSGVGLPVFASVLDQGSGSGRLQLRPAVGLAGGYLASVQAADDAVPSEATLSAVNIQVTACGSSVPSGIVSMSVDEGSLSWAAVPDASWYHVLQGEVGSLSAGGLAPANCLSAFLDATSLVESTVPAAGEILWFAVRGESCAGAGTFNSGGATQMGDRDVGVESAAATCPVVGCGNGYVEGGELCDGADLDANSCVTQGLDGGALSCNATCSGFDLSACTTLCGNGVRAGAESCDGADLDGNTCTTVGLDFGTLACDGSCQFDTSACTQCGDGIREDPEACDTDDLNGESCVSLGLDSGVLQCNFVCGFDLSQCLGCGNSQIDPGEICDGFDRGGVTCQDLGFSSGFLGCSADCGSFNTTFCNP